MFIAPLSTLQFLFVNLEFADFVLVFAERQRSLLCRAMYCCRRYVCLSVCLSVTCFTDGQPKDSSFRQKIDPYYRQQRCSAMTVVSGNIRFMQIFTGVLWKGGVKRQWRRALAHVLLLPASWRSLCLLSVGSSDVGFARDTRRFR